VRNGVEPEGKNGRPTGGFFSLSACTNAESLELDGILPKRILLSVHPLAGGFIGRRPDTSCASRTQLLSHRA
jgi:hypothetical protein